MRTACLLACAATVTFSAAPFAAVAAIPVYDHVVIVVEENHDYSTIISSVSAPYLRNTLIAEGASLTKMYGEEHVSQGNYLWLFSGSRQGILFSDPGVITPGLTTANLGAELWAKQNPALPPGNSYSFKSYSEDLPGPGSLVNTANGGLYSSKHNPWASFANIPHESDSNAATSTNLPYSGFFPATSGGYAALPTVSFVIPNQDHDMHNGGDPASIANGDNWLVNNINGYYQWAKTHNSLLIVTFDEGAGGSQGLTTPPSNQIVTVFGGANIAPGPYAEGNGVTHVNLLRTIEDMYSLPHAGAQLSTATTAGISNNAITDVFTPEPASLGLLCLGVVPLLVRRSRRHVV